MSKKVITNATCMSCGTEFPCDPAMDQSDFLASLEPHKCRGLWSFHLVEVEQTEVAR